MQMLNTYKKCLCCGEIYSMGEEKTHCHCGGFLYMIGQYYCQKIKKK